MIELKRRDNANIVKVMCSGIIDQILNKHSAEGAYEFTRDTLHKIITGKFKMDKFVITKTLKGNSLTKEERKLEMKKPKEQRTYVDRTRIVHAVLADRMADRDPGSKPLSNDRIPYVYVETKGNIELQGDRVETPEYIIENNLKMDYLFYITNQIKIPALKFLDLLIENASEIFREFEIKEENRKHGMMPLAFYADRDDANNNNDNNYSADEFDEISGADSDDNSNNDSDSEDERPKKVVKQSRKEKLAKLDCTDNFDDFVNFDNLECNTKIPTAKPKKKASKVQTSKPTKFNKINSDEFDDSDKIKFNKVVTSGDLLGQLDMNDDNTENLPSRLKNKSFAKSDKQSKQNTKTNIPSLKKISTFDLIDE